MIEILNDEVTAQQLIDQKQAEIEKLKLDQNNAMLKFKIESKDSVNIGLDILFSTPPFSFTRCFKSIQELKKFVSGL